MNRYMFINFVPNEVINEHNNLNRKRTLRKILFVILAVLIMAMGVETAFLVHNQVTGEHAVPASLKDEYKNAQATTLQIKKIQKVLNEAHKENRSLIEIVDTLAAIKPNEIKLTKLDLAENGIIQLEGYVNDPTLCNLYVEKINNEKDLFADAQVERINSNSFQEYKTFLIKTTIAKE